MEATQEREKRKALRETGGLFCYKLNVLLMIIQKMLAESGHDQYNYYQLFLLSFSIMLSDDPICSNR
jgi:hypothetical protein